MTDVTAEFFDDLAQRGHEPLLGHASGTMRFDIANGKKTETWFVSIDKGDLTVSRSGDAADSTLGRDRTACTNRCCSSNRLAGGVFAR